MVDGGGITGRLFGGGVGCTWSVGGVLAGGVVPGTDAEGGPDGVGCWWSAGGVVPGGVVAGGVVPGGVVAGGVVAGGVLGPWWFPECPRRRDQLPGFHHETDSV